MAAVEIKQSAKRDSTLVLSCFFFSGIHPDRVRQLRGHPPHRRRLLHTRTFRHSRTRGLWQSETFVISKHRCLSNMLLSKRPPPIDSLFYSLFINGCIVRRLLWEKGTRRRYAIDRSIEGVKKKKQLLSLRRISLLPWWSDSRVFYCLVDPSFAHPRD